MAFHYHKGVGCNTDFICIGNVITGCTCIKVIMLFISLRTLVRIPSLSTLCRLLKERLSVA